MQVMHDYVLSPLVITDMMLQGIEAIKRKWQVMFREDYLLSHFQKE